MANYTENLHLELPTQNEFYVIDKFNENFTKIDGVVSRPNLLDNTDFSNPVNQRNIEPSTWSYAEYGLDRWRSGGRTVVTSISPTLDFHRTENTLATGYVYQKIELLDESKTYTFSAMVNGRIITCTDTFPVSGENSHDFGDVRIAFNRFGDNYCGMVIYTPEDNSKVVSVAWCKLEEGDFPTAWEKPDYMTELLKCKKYYRYFFVKSIAYNVSSNLMTFMIPVDIDGMREKPVSTLRDPTISPNGGGALSGFTFSITSSDNFRVQIQAVKNAHGLSFSNCPSLQCVVYQTADL